MKRSWFGLALLLILLGAGFACHWGSAKLCDPTRKALEEAAQAALNEDWATVQQRSDRARQQWERILGISSAVADHRRLEQIQAGFSNLEVWLTRQDPAAAAACCRELACQLEALADSQELSWRNVL